MALPAEWLSEKLRRRIMGKRPEKKEVGPPIMDGQADDDCQVDGEKKEGAGGASLNPDGFEWLGLLQSTGRQMGCPWAPRLI